MYKLLQKKLFKIVGVVFILLTANFVCFFRFYIFDLLPFPGDLLVSFFFPWNSGGFVGYDQWTTHKEAIAADVVRQMFPWKVYMFNELSNGTMPLWNPHSFSGYPLLANLQSSLFFPFNVIFFITTPINAWISLVVGLPLVTSLFSLIFFRSLKMNLWISTLGAVIMINLGYVMVWHEQLIITQVSMWLPLLLWLVNRFQSTNKRKYIILLMLCISFAIFGGHAQTFIYLAIILLVYMLICKLPLKLITCIFIAGTSLGAIQLFPTIEIYLHSAREGQATRELFTPFVLSWKNIINLIAPDFFGNPATNNFWGRNYGDFQTYYGIVAFFLSLLALFEWRNLFVRVFIFLACFGWLFATWPGAYISHWLHLPIIGSGVPARAVYIFQFSMAVLSVYGLNALLSGVISAKKTFLITLLGWVVYVLLLVSTRFLTPDISVIARNNLYIPLVIYLIITLVFGSRIYFKDKKWINKIIIAVLFITMIFEYGYLFNKYQPFAPKKFVFPSHPVTEFLQNKTSLDRFFGFGSAYIDNNFSTLYGFNSIEGWDSLYIKRYGEFLASAKNGEYNTDLKRSDALIPSIDNEHRNRVFDLLGVKYILDKNDNPSTNWEPEDYKFSPERYRLVWQKYKWKAYERLTTLPRVFLASSYEVIANDKWLLKRFYEKDFDYKNTLLLEAEPKVNLTLANFAQADIKTYSSTKIVIETKSDANQLLFISDVYLPGWKATVDGINTKIFRTNYIFRSIYVPAGEHTIEFMYMPISFYGGLMTSLTVVVMLCIYAYETKRKNIF